MDYKVLQDFSFDASIPQETINQYQEKLPKVIIDIWKEFGFGSFMNGYFKIIDPTRYQPLLERTYFRGKNAIPIMATGLGDLITWEENEYLSIIKYRYGTFNIMEHGCKYFFDDLLDKRYQADYIKKDQYDEAVTLYGAPAYDQCYGYVPLLALGGAESPSRLRPVGIYEHISLIGTLVGPIE